MSAWTTAVLWLLYAGTVHWLCERRLARMRADMELVLRINKALCEEAKR